jgi:uncharacterized protein YjbI with pentapeptide repeats
MNLNSGFIQYENNPQTIEFSKFSIISTASFQIVFLYTEEMPIYNSPIYQHDNSPTWQFANMTFRQGGYSPLISQLTFSQHVNSPTYISPTCQFTNMTFRQHDISPTWHFMNLQFANFPFANMTFRQHDIRQQQFANLHFTNMTFRQHAISQTWDFANMNCHVGEL